MPAKKARASGAPEASSRRRSGRTSSSATKSQYFEADSDEDDDASPPASTKVANGSSKKRGRPTKNTAPARSSSAKKAKLESDDDDGDEYAEEDSDAKPDMDEDDDEDEDDSDAPPRVTIEPLVKLRETGGVPYEDDRLHKNTFLFLKDLKENNQRSWLKSHDKEFRRAQKDWHSYVETLMEKIIAVDPTIPELPVKDVVMRIYRDIRFSNDPTPYRPFFAAAFSRTGRKGPYACYYIHCMPGGSFIGGGLFQPDAASIAKLRVSIDRHPERWRAAVSDAAFSKTFLSGAKAGDVEGCIKAFCKKNKENALKKKPRDYPADHPNIELLKLRNFTVDRKAIPDSVFMAENGQQQIADLVRAMAGFVSFLNDIVMPDPNAESSSDDENEVEDDDDEDEG